MDMNKTFMLRKEDVDRTWHVIDASDQVLGRLSTTIADMLRGKIKMNFTPHTDNGDYVVVVNCDKIKLTGKKWKDKMYVSYSGWRSGRKERSAEEVFAKEPGNLIRLAVKRMLPKNRQSRVMLRRLRVYTGAEHPHQAQIR